MSKDEEKWLPEPISEEDMLKYANAIIDYFIGSSEENDRKWIQEDIFKVVIGLSFNIGMRKERLATALPFIDIFRNKKKNQLVFGTLSTYMVVFYDIIHKLECDRYESMWRYNIMFKFEL
jgi:hypothetical protein